MRRKSLVLVAALIIGCSTGGESGRSFDQELQLTLRAGRGELTEIEKKQLLQENHPILAQVGDPQAFKLVELFSRLPEADRQRLLNDSYVKWRMVDLDSETQQLSREMIGIVLQVKANVPSPYEGSAAPEMSRSLMEQTEIGFAVVEIEKTKQKVVSWFAFGPKLTMPLWVTVVNSDASKSPDYVQAHMQRLPLLRSMKSSSPPKLQFHPTILTSMV